MTETELTKQIRDVLDMYGIFHWKHWGGGHGKYKNKTGISDIIGIYHGIFIGIEVKVDKNQPSKAQADFIKEINARGGIAFVARSVEDVKKGLKLK